MKKLFGIIKGKKGTSFPLIVAVTLALTITLCGITEYMRLMIIASGVRDAVQSAIISTVNDNYDDVYHGVREGYAGGYKPRDFSWEDSIDYGDIYGYLDKTLGLEKDGRYHVKYAGEEVEFKVSDLSIDIINVPIAPSNPGSMNGFLADAVIRLEVPVSFGGKSLPLMRINLKVQAKFMPLF